MQHQQPEFPRGPWLQEGSQPIGEYIISMRNYLSDESVQERLSPEVARDLLGLMSAMHPPYTNNTMNAMRIISETVYSFGLKKHQFSTQCAIDGFGGLAKGFLERRSYAENMYDLMHKRSEQHVTDENKMDEEDQETEKEKEARAKLDFASDNYSLFMNAIRLGEMDNFRDKMRSEYLPEGEDTPMAQDIHFLSQRVGECRLDPTNFIPNWVDRANQTMIARMKNAMDHKIAANEEFIALTSQLLIEQRVNQKWLIEMEEVVCERLKLLFVQ